MACNCCGQQGCKCKLIDSSSESGFNINGFGYGNGLYWIHRDYPESIANTTWLPKYGIRVASNSIIDTNPPFSPECPYISGGDYNTYTRSGTGGVFSLIGFDVEHWNGDASNGIPFPLGLSRFEFKTDTDVVTKTCNLYARMKTSGDGVTFSDWTEWEIIDSVSFNQPHLGNRVITLPYDIPEVNSVELIFRCSAYVCFNPALVEFSGGPSYIKGPIITNAPFCTSYGSYNGVFNYKYQNIPAGQEEFCYGYRVKNTETFIRAEARICPDFIGGWNPTRSAAQIWGGGIGDEEGLNPQLCFGKRYGVYTNFDGTETIGPTLNIGAYATWNEDPFRTNIVSVDEISYVGLWYYGAEKVEWIYDCSKLGSCDQQIQIDEPEIWSIGNVTATRI